jgi:Family of unknown function (DUF5578)
MSHQDIVKKLRANKSMKRVDSVNAATVKLPKRSNCTFFSDVNMTNAWDKGSRIIRQDVLTLFLEEMTNNGIANLEKEFNNGACVFLLKITAWLRQNYLNGYQGLLTL